MFRSIPWVVFGAVFIPALLTTVVGIVILALGTIPLGGSIALGVLTICFAIFVVSGASVTLWLLRRQNELTLLQTEFVANVSHELRTPLASIRMFVETLRMGRVRSPRETEECLDALEQETARLSDLVERLLAFRTSERCDPFLTNRDKIAPADALDTALTPLLRQPDTGRRISLSVEERLPRVEIHPSAFSEAISNLVRNALTHGGDGPVLVAARASEGGVTFEVKDHGPGVAPREVKKVFERFYRASTTTESRVPGFGLGLSIVQHFAQSHGGRATAQNLQEGGALFSIWLPAAPQGASSRDEVSR